MTNGDAKWYPTKVDLWLIPLLCLPPMAAVLVTVFAVLASSMVDLIVGGAISVLIAGVYLGLIFPIRYGISDTYLFIRHGISCQKVLLADITDVHPTRNPLSSPALSLDRLQVKFGEGFFRSVMISPSDRNVFLDELAKQANLKRVGDRLSRS